MTPCLCGHALHLWRACDAGCGCPRGAPDYVAGAIADGEVLSPEREAKLKLSSQLMADQLGYKGPPRAGLKATCERKVCEYCLGEFDAKRATARTCSGACREAVSQALSYGDDADVPSISVRKQTFSQARRDATGNGVMTPQQAYEADWRVRALHAQPAYVMAT